VGADGSGLRPRGHCDRHLPSYTTNKLTERPANQLITI
jgi:hypothetical protein